MYSLLLTLLQVSLVLIEVAIMFAANYTLPGSLVVPAVIPADIVNDLLRYRNGASRVHMWGYKLKVYSCCTISRVDFLYMLLEGIPRSIDFIGFLCELSVICNR